MFLKLDSTWHLIEDEEAFWALGLDFGDVVTVGDRVFECDTVGEPLPATLSVSCWADADTWSLWVLDGISRTALRVEETEEWTAVVRSWGLDPWGQCAGTAADFGRMHASAGARFRDGTLVKQHGASAVYVVSDGIAWPIVSWDVLEDAGWGERRILEVRDGTLDELGIPRGNCAAGGSHCVTEEALRTCGQDGVVGRG
ncbi:MAG: hypothetical protein Q8P41_14055 [Pseudomonadota bacterium]|nr:hypothetical protein [Pseudomonadota bacterium]